MEMFHTHMHMNALLRVDHVLRSHRISEGPEVVEFEQRLASDLGLANPVAVNSGTSALYLALRLAGVGPGDRVILPAVTFIATAAAILQCGAVPVFADVDPYTGNLDPESVAVILKEQRIHYLNRAASSQPGGPVKAVVAVHWLGLPCDLKELGRTIHSHYEDNKADGWSSGFIGLVQDAAHALGTSYQGHPLSSSPWCRYVAFSFQATKHLTTGDGGAVCSNASFVANGAKKLRWFGIDRSLPIGPLGEREFELNEVGGKCHMNDVAAAIGLGNLDGFADRLDIRRRHNDHYRDELETMIGLRLLDSPTDRESACYAFGLRVERRGDFARAMKERGVPCSVIASRIDKYGYPAVRRPLPGTDVFDLSFVAVPCHEALTDDDVDMIIRSIRKGW